MYITRAELLYCSVNILFSDVLVAVVVPIWLFLGTFKRSRRIWSYPSRAALSDNIAGIPEAYKKQALANHNGNGNENVAKQKV